MKKWFMTMIILFALPLCLLGLVSLTDTDRTISVSENRALAEKPAFSLSALFSGEYTLDFETYYSDTFPLRDAFLGVNSFLNRFYFYGGGDSVLVLDYNGADAATGGESLDDLQSALASASPGVSSAPAAASASPSASVSIRPSASPSPTPSPLPSIDTPTREDTFDTGGSIIIVGNRAMEIPYENETEMQRYAETLSRITAENPQCAVYSLITPNSGEFYSPDSYHTGHASQKDMIEKTYAMMDPGVTCIDAYDALRAHTDQYIYFRTDHHWTALGAYYAYTALCQAKGFKAEPLSYFRTGRYDTFLGSLYTWSKQYAQAQALKDDPDYVEYYLPLAQCSAQYYSTMAMDDGISIPVIDTNISADYSNKYLCFIRGDTPICHITSSCGSGLSCIVIKESFANALVPFLTSHYQDIYVVDPRKFNSSKNPAVFKLTGFAQDNGIDDIFVVNYPFMINNRSYIGMMRNLCDDVS